MTDNLAVAVETPPEPKQRPRKQPADATPKKQPPYAVVVFNDDVHTFEYVIETFTKGHPQQRQLLGREAADRRASW
jgi:ATP-dependent Clp protease adapter protein ClpS